MTELSKPENQTLILSGKYTVSTGGTLDGSGITSKEIPVSGDKPSAGELHYTNNTLQGGCLVIGDYQVIFDGSSVSSTTKGDCSDYNYIDLNLPTMSQMCPGCVFTTNTIDEDKYIGSDTVTNYETDYTKLNRHVFLGYILDDNTHIIQRAFLCGINGTTPFCIEATTDNTIIANNIDNLNKIFSNKETSNGEMFWYMDGHIASSDRKFIEYHGDGSYETAYDSEYGSLCVISPAEGRTGCYSS